MTWLWKSDDEFKKCVSPLGDPELLLNIVQSETRLEQVQRIATAVQSMTLGLANLRKLECLNQPLSADMNTYAPARSLVLEIANSGEELIFLDERLVRDRSADDFIAVKKLHEDWQHHADAGTLMKEIQAFLLAVDNLLEGFSDNVREDSELFLEGSVLPEFLLREFKLARDLFSVGFDEVGIFAAGRGLEGVLRAFAGHKGVFLRHQGKTRPASEADFRDLIEICYRLRWKSDKSRIIDQDTKSLLDLLRTVRNSTAHPNQRRQQQNWRELAIMTSTTANNLWKDAQRKRAQLVSKTVDKDWP
jgi:hypothetical protein